MKIILFSFALFSMSAPALAAEGDLPQQVPQSAASRVYLFDTSSYDVMTPLGKVGVVDTANNVVTAYIDKAHFRCDPAQAAKSKVAQMPPSRTYYFVMDNKIKGSVALFVASASLSDEQKYEVMLDDIASVDLDATCQVDARYMSTLLQNMPTATGKRIFYVTGATLSHLSKQMYTSQGADAKLSVGSWLSVGGSYYKGSQQVDSVPLLSLRGYYIDVPKKALAEAVQDIMNSRASLTSFSTLQDLGVADDKVTLGVQATSGSP